MNSKSNTLTLLAALFILGALCVSIVPMRQTLAEVPWRYLPVSLAETSEYFYAHTFIAAAKQYVEFVDGVAEIQADSYRTTSLAVAGMAPFFVQIFSEKAPPAPVHFQPPTLTMEYVPASVSTPTALTYLPEEVGQASAEFYTGVAQYFIDGVYAVGDAQVYTYEAIVDTMQTSANTIGVETAAAIIGAANWYAASANRIDSRLTAE